MNIQQLEYLVAVDQHRHFVKASEHCHVTQATLSMMIKKFEDELGVKVFDRTRQPVEPTEIGFKLIAQAKRVLSELKHMKEIIQQQEGTLSGELRIGIIPTLAPQLLPRFMTSFLEKYPEVILHISESTTEDILHKLENSHLDVGILATPLNHSGFTEIPLFYEQFVVYASSGEKLLKKKYLLSEDIDVNRLWMLEEGHCLRSQTINLCELKKKERAVHRVDFEAGSIETLRKIVEMNHGITILPELATSDLTSKQLKNVRHFKAPVPSREISAITYGAFSRKNLLEALCHEIKKSVPKEMLLQGKKEVIDLVE